MRDVELLQALGLGAVGSRGRRVTLSFESLVMMLARGTGRVGGGRWGAARRARLWRILKHHVDQARRRATTARCGRWRWMRRRGHNYIMLFADLNEARSVYEATAGSSYRRRLYRSSTDCMPRPFR